MFLFRIGKEKLAYTLTMAIHKLKYSHLSTLTSGSQIEIHVKRGNHELKYLSTVNKKGQIVQDKKIQSIPMTLYFDADDKTFNSKEMIVQGKVKNQYGEEQVDLGEAELNIAEYAKEEGMEKFILEVELEGSKNAVCKIKFNVTIERNLDQKDNFETTTQQTLEKEQKNSKKSSEKIKTRPKETSLQSSIKKQQEKSELPQKSQLKKKPFIQSTLKRNKENKQQRDEFNEQYQQTAKPVSPKVVDFQPPSQDTETVVLGRETSPKLKKAQNSSYSAQLQLYEAEQLLKAKQRQIFKLKQMLEDQQKINLLLVEEQRKETKFKEANKSNRQISQLRTQLEVANMKMSQLQSSNRNYLDQIERSGINTEKMTKQIIYYKDLLEKEKIKVAELLQRALEKGDIDLISFIEETFADF